MRPGALGMREVVAPHDVADADLVALREVAPTGVGRAEPAVAIEVVARPHGEVLGEVGVELLRAVVAVEDHVHHPQQVRRPERTALGDGHAQARVPLEHAREHHEPEWARRPEAHLGGVHADEAGSGAVVLTRSRRRSACAPACAAPRTPPTPGRTRRSWYVRVLARHRRDEDPAAQSRLAGAADLADRGVDVVVDRHQRDAAPRRSGLSLHSSASQRLWAPGAGHEQHRIVLGAHARARHRMAPSCRRARRRHRGRSPRRPRRRRRAPCRGAPRPSCPRGPLRSRRTTPPRTRLLPMIWNCSRSASRSARCASNASRNCGSR